MMNKRKQRGVALLFALGMLTLLLVSGMAFVANALTAHKIAANNSARSQARIFAQSALSRVLASMMLYQYQLQKLTGDAPENFDAVQSYDSGSTASDDGLEHKPSEGKESLLKLPADNSIISVGIANQFNTKLSENNNVTWVNFYDSIDKGKIIGRAAWKTISTSPQISAPVFMSGKLETDDSPGWMPVEHRWGREIDEVSLDGSFFKHVSASRPEFKMQTYETIYSELGFGNGDEAKKRFIDRWFMPDADSTNFLKEPTAFVPEEYFCQKGKDKYPMMRFNISELLIEDYGFSQNSGADPWYARFGIDSSQTDKINNSDILEKLANNSQQRLMNDKYDFDLKAEDRSGLPFLRRIGNSAGTFENITALRKQIAANFNDYCDADSVPTSDKAAETWMDEITGDYKHPTFTGNEKTPYIYELGLGMSVFRDENCKSTGITVTQESKNGSNNYYSAQVDAYLSVFPLVKMANIYNFTPEEGDKFTVGVDLEGPLEIKFKPTIFSLEVKYSRKPLIGAAKEETLTLSNVHVRGKTGLTTIIEADELTGTIDDGNFKTAILTVNDNSKIDNKNGQNPYPLIVPNELSDECNALAPANRKLKLSGNIRFKLDLNALRTLVTTYDSSSLIKLLGTITIKEVTIKEVSAIEITSVKFNVKRTYLAVKRKGKDFGLDYVKALPEVSYTMTSARNGNAVEIKAASDGKIPGMYVGGIRNYDPRQNLNKDDWYRSIRAAGGDNISKPLNDSGINDVMKLSGSASIGWTGAVNQANTNAETEENNKFKPNHNSDLNDDEKVAGPGWSYSEGSDNIDGKRISTAYIRNAPMMSPWEIGLIHRGVRWQTINLKSACNPENNAENITFEGHKPFDGWDKSGTPYTATGDYFGDAAILDQIKMTDACFTYGKINVNRLRSNDPLFNKEGLNLEKYIAKALFEKLRYGEDIAQFYKDSKRDNNDNLPNNDSTISAISSFDNYGNLFVNRNVVDTRAAFIAETKGNMEDAFSSASIKETDAAQEEIIGKTINLLGADATSPSQIKVVVVAQVIKDVAGSQVRNGAVKDDCAFGVFDPGYDEIIGEVKMLVTIDRDVSTGRMMISRTDYLE